MTLFYSAKYIPFARPDLLSCHDQVNNRDMSIAVLRTYVSKRKEEHESMLSKKTAKHDGQFSNGECKEQVQDDLLKISEEHVKGTNTKKQELRPPKVLEALSASGLRALRYAREVEGIGQVVALDNDKVSVEACKRNIKYNGSVACEKVESHLVDARVFMLTHPKEFDVVDLDPYGSPSVFLDSAVQSVADGGILMCTATDLAVLCGGNGEVCYSKYGSYPLKGKYCHEMALRILLACIESHANRYKRYIVPILSVQMDFYVRVFVRMFTLVLNSNFLTLVNNSSASAMKNTPLKLSYVYQCVGCDSFHLQSLARTISKFSMSISVYCLKSEKEIFSYQECSSVFHLTDFLSLSLSPSLKNNSLRYLPGFGPAVPQECGDCGKKFNMGGPIWSAPIHDQEWISSILADVNSMKDRYPAYDRIYAVLTTVSEELPDVPLFLSLHNLCSTLKCTSPSAVMFRSSVINAGYSVSGTHVNPLGLKSDAPMSVIWDIMRCWVKNHPVKDQAPDQSGSVILAKEPTLQVCPYSLYLCSPANFARAVASLSKAQTKKMARFLPNPEKHWGPKLRAGRQITSKHASLLGPKAVNGANCPDEPDEPDEPNTKRQKIDDPVASI
ncbi:hypothetical protein IFM89_039137 [Coptis chinensis]|uniref:tRNA (guanine(26)-N(2))-dimethyltransferase n=1 Tax=Coptis chinensis TaxID=261450 RepID=A0A835LCW5_9MAGN|nr:hypothetical protein IFM89_039137 [Coptis chinensis]